MGFLKPAYIGSLKFNGAVLTKVKSTLALTAPHHGRKLQLIETENLAREEYVSHRARGAYIASVCRPDLSFRFAFAAQYQNPEKKEGKELKKAIEICLKSPQTGLQFIQLDLPSVYMGIFIDASFAGNTDYTSQLGFVACLIDKFNRANIVHYGSTKSKRVTRSVLSAELYGMVYGFDTCSVIHYALKDFLGRDVALKIITDSKSLFDSLVTLNMTTEKRLLIELSMLRPCYEKREISEVLWIPGIENPADAFTKSSACNALSPLMFHL